MRNKCFFAVLLAWFTLSAGAQSISLSKEDRPLFSAQWKGERFPDGRPKVPDAILARMKDVSVEEAWGILRGEGHHNQFAGDWQTIRPGLATYDSSTYDC